VGGRSADATQLTLLSQQNIREQQLAKLRSMRSNGRVALELPTGSLNPADLPPIQLEDGDSFTVPSQPSFVSAFGAVHNENVLVYRPGRTVQDVLSVAGPTQDAEIADVFVVRADGTVTTAISGGWARRTLLGGTVASTELMPGDSVVVPTKVDRETTWSFITRQFKDWTQILGNLGLGVAAFKSL
jgi:protein involved in polysaccharide export with SLBB domain